MSDTNTKLETNAVLFYFAWRNTKHVPLPLTKDIPILPRCSSQL